MTTMAKLSDSLETRATTWTSLQDAISRLTRIEENEDLVVTLTLGWDGDPDLKFLERRTAEIASALEQHQVRSFMAAIDMVRGTLDRGFPRSTQGLAVYARAGARSFLHALPFAAPLQDTLVVGHAPHVLPLVELKDSYHRFVVLLTTESSARILEISLGSVTQDIWAAREPSEPRIVGGWLRRRYETRRAVRRRFVKEKIRILEDVMRNGRHAHLILAGDPGMVATVRSHLSTSLRDRLVDMVRLPEQAGISTVTARTLEAFLEGERKESLDLAATLAREIRRNGLAVAGVPSTLEALVDDRVDVLLLDPDLVEPRAWNCRDCDGRLYLEQEPVRCADCESDSLRERDLREQLIRLAESRGRRVEFVRGSDLLKRLGGVGALLRYRPVEY